MASTQAIDIGGSDEDVADRLDSIEAQQLRIIELLEDVSEKLDNISISGSGFEVVEEL